MLIFWGILLLLPIVVYIGSVLRRLITFHRKALDLDGKVLPGPDASYFGKNLPSLKNMAKLRLSDDLENLKHEYGGFYALQLPIHVLLVLSNPEDVKLVLSGSHTLFPKGIKYEEMKCLFGNGLVNSNGDIWQFHRKLVSPAFAAEKLKEMVPAFARHAKLLVEWWKERGIIDCNEKTVDWHYEMSSLTCDVICDVGFGFDLSSKKDPTGHIAKAIQTCLSEVTHRVRALSKIPSMLPTQRQRAFQKAVNLLNGIIAGLIEARKQWTGEAKHDLLELLMAAADEETKQRLSNQDLRDEMLTFLGAGHETTANLLSWTCYCLGSHPQVLAKLLMEIDSIQDPSNTETLAKMEYTEAVLNESMRLHPPVTIISRRNTKEVCIRGYRMAAGTSFLLNIWSLHRCPSIWGDDASQFRPERWLQGNTYHPFAFVPFSAGPRKCIGRVFAMLEAKAILGVLLKEVVPVLVSTEEPLRVETITNRPQNGIHVKLISREKFKL